MARSLGKEARERIDQLADTDLVYERVSRLFLHPPDDGELWEIELLGTGFALEPGLAFLRSEACIAIPKIRLAQAFSVAYRNFRRARAGAGAGSGRDGSVQDAAVLLLADPEHVSAANARKRAVEAALAAGTAPPESVLGREKQFVDSLLTARLHRHTKSPTLWAHRRWLMERFAAAAVPVPVRSDLRRVVMVAAERHPRNYYAWTHARWLVRQAEAATTTDGACLALRPATMVAEVKDWCFRHHDDISGWIFLAFLIRRVGDDELGPRLCTAIVADTLRVVEALRLTNESVWVFLRTVVTGGAGRVDPVMLRSFMATNRTLSALQAEDSLASKTLARAYQWASEHHQPGGGSVQTAQMRTDGQQLSWLHMGPGRDGIPR